MKTKDVKPEGVKVYFEDKALEGFPMNEFEMEVPKSHFSDPVRYSKGYSRIRMVKVPLRRATTKLDASSLERRKTTYIFFSMFSFFPGTVTAQDKCNVVEPFLHWCCSATVSVRKLDLDLYFDHDAPLRK